MPRRRHNSSALDVLANLLDEDVLGEEVRKRYPGLPPSTLFLSDSIRRFENRQSICIGESQFDHAKLAGVCAQSIVAFCTKQFAWFAEQQKHLGSVVEVFRRYRTSKRRLKTALQLFDDLNNAPKLMAHADPMKLAAMLEARRCLTRIL